MRPNETEPLYIALSEPLTRIHIEKNKNRFDNSKFYSQHSLYGIKRKYSRFMIHDKEILLGTKDEIKRQISAWERTYIERTRGKKN